MFILIKLSFWSVNVVLAKCEFYWTINNINFMTKNVHEAHIFSNNIEIWPIMSCFNETENKKTLKKVKN